MNRATYSGVSYAWCKTDERYLKRRVMRGTKKTSIPLGDGKASVSVTRGFKSWLSLRKGGMTVESTVNVSLTCGQSKSEVTRAIEEAGRIAEGKAIEGDDEMSLHLESFKKKMEEIEEQGW